MTEHDDKMDTILIRELEVWYSVGLSDEERRKPQRLLLNVELGRDFEAAAHRDDLRKTIDYGAVCQRLLGFGQNTSWRLLETLILDIVRVCREEFGASTVTVEVQKFIIPQARFVGVRVTR